MTDGEYTGMNLEEGSTNASEENSHKVTITPTRTFQMKPDQAVRQQQCIRLSATQKPDIWTNRSDVGALRNDVWARRTLNRSCRKHHDYRKTHHVSIPLTSGSSSPSQFLKDYRNTTRRNIAVRVPRRSLRGVVAAIGQQPSTYRRSMLYRDLCESQVQYASAKGLVKWLRCSELPILPLMNGFFY